MQFVSHPVRFSCLSCLVLIHTQLEQQDVPAAQCSSGARSRGTDVWGTAAGFIYKQDVSEQAPWPPAPATGFWLLTATDPPRKLGAHPSPWQSGGMSWVVSLSRGTACSKGMAVIPMHRAVSRSLRAPFGDEGWSLCHPLARPLRGRTELWGWVCN